MIHKLLGILLITLMTEGHSSATLMKKMSLRSLSNQSDGIFVGQVSGVQTIVDRGEIWTLVTIAVEKHVKGTHAATVHFRMPGGVQIVKGRTIVTEYEGVPRLEILQRCVFFLEGSAPQYFKLTGLHQGLWRISLHDGVEIVVP